jgi:DNA polymerase
MPVSKRADPSPEPQPPVTDAVFGRGTLDQLREAAAKCRRCDLYLRGTQTVFGAGRPKARIMLIGEQPGNDEDLEGLPFVGPAGKLLSRALKDAGIDRDAVYLTNAVKHFKWIARGKRRIHSKPSGREVRACKPWLESEIDRVDPDIIVLLGATAAQALLGAQFRLTQHRGEVLAIPERGAACFATVHPSAILRAPDDDTRRVEYATFVDDLRTADRHHRRAA